MAERFLPYGCQYIDDDDIAAVAAVLKSPMLTCGPQVPQFEAELAAKTGAVHCVACSSGTAALHLAALGLGVGPGCTAVVPAITFLASANAVRLAGGEVIFADVAPETGLMTPETFESALARADVPPTLAVPVHLAGQCVDMAAIRELARGMAILEDACHAIGSVLTGSGPESPVGQCRHSDATVFSFHPVKTVTAGEGGAITTGDAALARRMTRLRGHGMVHAPEDFLLPEEGLDHGQPNPWYYEMHDLGLNYRLTDLQCVLGRSQLAKLDLFTAKRQALCTAYETALAGLAPMVRPLRRVPGCRPCRHLFCVLIDFKTAGRSRREVMLALRERGIGSQVHYIPVHRQPYYRQRYGQTSLPGAEAFYERVLSLPLFHAMEEDDVLRVADALTAVLAG